MRSVLGWSLAVMMIGAIVGSSGCHMLGEAGPKISQQDFDATLGGEELVLVKFGATWCGPCRMIDRELDQLDAEAGFPARVLKVDVDANRDLARAYKVGGIPHLILFRGGQPIDEQVGYMSAGDLEGWVAGHSQP